VSSWQLEQPGPCRFCGEPARLPDNARPPHPRCAKPRQTRPQPPAPAPRARPHEPRHDDSAAAKSLARSSRRWVGCALPIHTAHRVIAHRLRAYPGDLAAAFGRQPARSRPGASTRQQPQHRDLCASRPRCVVRGGPAWAGSR
jgi:hypothetical protein